MFSGVIPQLSLVMGPCAGESPLQFILHVRYITCTYVRTTCTTCISVTTLLFQGGAVYSPAMTDFTFMVKVSCIFMSLVSRDWALTFS